MEKDSTQYRYVASKNLDTIIFWINNLPYKVELKGGATKSGAKWYQFFVVPDIMKEVVWGDLDG